jgi:HSP20 family protein
MNRLFDDVYRSGVPTAKGGSVGDLLDTNINVSETENEIRVTAELPGVSEDDIDVRLDDDVLTIRGEKKFERSEGGEKEDYHFVERSYGTFQRSLRLPTHVEPDKVQANCDNGVLKITLPKSQHQERTRRIQVQGQKAQQGQKVQQQQKVQRQEEKGKREDKAKTESARKR